MSITIIDIRGQKMYVMRCKSRGSREGNVCDKRRKTKESEGGDTSRGEGGRRIGTRSVIQNSEQTEDMKSEIGQT